MDSSPDNTTSHRPPWQVILIILLVAAGLVLTAFFGFRFYRSVFSLHHYRVMSQALAHITKTYQTAQEKPGERRPGQAAAKSVRPESQQQSRQQKPAQISISAAEEPGAAVRTNR